MSSSADKTLRMWDAETGPAPPKEEWVTLLCDKLSANML
jgi:WD40 repeat protein